MNLQELYKTCCRETGRNGGVIIGSSIREFFEWVEKEYVLMKEGEHFE